MKDYEYPCRGCDEFSRWELADAPPWPQFPRAVEQWHAMKDAMRPNVLDTGALGRPVV